MKMDFYGLPIFTLLKKFPSCISIIPLNNICTKNVGGTLLRNKGQYYKSANMGTKSAER